jgi:hypothetical protein
VIAARGGERYPGCMKSKDRNSANPRPDRDFKGMLLKLGDIWDDDFQVIMDEIVEKRRHDVGRPLPDLFERSVSEGGNDT